MQNPRVLIEQMELRMQFAAPSDVPDFAILRPDPNGSPVLEIRGTPASNSIRVGIIREPQEYSFPESTRVTFFFDGWQRKSTREGILAFGAVTSVTQYGQNDAIDTSVRNLLSYNRLLVFLVVDNDPVLFPWDWYSGGEINRPIVKIEAGGGNDRVLVTRSLTQTKTILIGGNGNDTLIGGRHEDSISGGPGNDQIRTDAARGALLEGGSGNDTIVGGFGSDTINAGAGDDKIDGGDPFDVNQSTLNPTRGKSIVRYPIIGGSTEPTFSARRGVRDVIDGGRGTDEAVRDDNDARVSVERLI